MQPDTAYLHLTSNNTIFGTQWREFPDTGDVPLVADFDGDTVADIGVYRPSTGYWYILNSSAGYAAGVGNWLYQWGNSGDAARPGDFDGDGKADIAVYRPSSGQWFVRLSTYGYSTSQTGNYLLGANGDLSLPQP